MDHTSRNPTVARLLRQQAALAHFGSYVFQEPSLQNILSEAARVCAEGLDVPLCKISRFREADNDFIVEAGYGWQVGVIGQVVTKCDNSTPHGRAFISGKPAILQDLRIEYSNDLPSYYKMHGVISIIDVLIRSKEGLPYGVLEIDSPVFHIYDKHDIDFLTGFANVLAEAVATANRNQTIYNIMKQMETLVVKMKLLVAEKDQALEDLDMMSEELKHRVRNNLQIIHAMLANHVKILTGRKEKASAYAIMRRVISLATVYEQLLGTGMGRIIELGDYLKALCTRLPALQQSEISDVKLTCVVTPVLVDIDTATALGMAVAELIANSFEHAFNNSDGCIKVKLSAAGNGAAGTVTISDNGKGFVEQPGSKQHGVGLVRRLVQQIKGETEMQSGRGTMWTLRFPVIPVQDLAS